MGPDEPKIHQKEMGPSVFETESFTSRQCCLAVRPDIQRCLTEMNNAGSDYKANFFRISDRVNVLNQLDHGP